jgi:hypothetical protein
MVVACPLDGHQDSFFLHMLSKQMPQVQQPEVDISQSYLQNYPKFSISNLPITKNLSNKQLLPKLLGRKTCKVKPQ